MRSREDSRPNGSGRTQRTNTLPASMVTLIVSTRSANHRSEINRQIVKIPNSNQTVSQFMPFNKIECCIKIINIETKYGKVQ